MVRGRTPDLCWRLMDAQHWASPRLARRQRRLLFFESKDELIYHYGLIHCGEKLFREIDRGDILAWRKQDYEYQILVADREAAARKYKGCVIDPATLDDIMLLYIKGGSL